ncbi:MAG: sigma-70 family RNA polymerase sigma factor [Candidatus Eisenbacteria bacterium]|nr:sigma-70 family RNA polymerase sigma factor [Candidatus Eisenbacteria bacterium]
MRYDITNIGGPRGSFPTTIWTVIEGLDKLSSEEYRTALNFLIERYWKPVYMYVRRRGYDNERAKDLVQDFFLRWIGKELFGRANRERGRFRSYMLTALRNFLSNAHRADMAAFRRPPGGIVSVEDLITEDGPVFEIKDEETPERAFEREWSAELLRRVLKRLEEEWSDSGKEVHLDLFRRWIIEPSLFGVEPPPLSELAEVHGLKMHDASNRVTTAKRAFKRLLRQEISLCASSDEEVDQEMAELLPGIDRE